MAKIMIAAMNNTKQPNGGGSSKMT
jgi:hypothetical protein